MGRFQTKAALFGRAKEGFNGTMLGKDRILGNSHNIGEGSASVNVELGHGWGIF